VQIIRNKLRESELFESIRKNFSEKDAERRGGIKLSDLLYPRRSYHSKMHPMPPSDEEIQYWVVGRGHEDAVHRIAGLEKEDSKVWNGIWYGIDFYVGHPIEMKTRRGYLAKEGEEEDRYDSYLKQLIGYCACEDKMTGELWVWSLLEKKDAFRSAPEMACYDCTFTREEIEDEKQRLMDTKRLLMSALAGDEDAYNSFQDCPQWMCFSKDSTMITPPRCKTCSRDFQTDWGLNKHKESKGGKTHEVEFATYETKLLPRCKYFEWCKGGNNVIVRSED
jgi:hypothetical protein